MPSYTRGKSRDKLTFVRMGAASTLYYGFRTKDLAAVGGVSAADLTACGHQLVSEMAASNILILGANSPKPPRVRKRVAANPTNAQQGSVSTFCAPASLGTAAAAGFFLSKGGRGVKITPTGRSVTAAAEVSATGGFYCFPMNSADFAEVSADLGLIIPNSAAERAKCYTGTTSPRPAIVKKQIAGAAGAAGSTISTFCSYDKIDTAIVAGWEVIKEAIPGLLGTAAP